MSEMEPLYQIAADTAVNDNGENCVILFGDSGVPDVILCDGETYRPERTCRKVPGRMRYGERKPKCSECGYSLGDPRWFYCPKCGGKIIDGRGDT